MPRLVLFFVLTLQLSIAYATTPLETYKIPKPLKPWVDWVLQDEINYQCPFFFNNFANKRCSWSGGLDLQLVHQPVKKGHIMIYNRLIAK